MTWTSSDLAGLRIAGDTSRRAERRSNARGAARLPQADEMPRVDPGARQAPIRTDEIYLPVTPCPKPRMTQRDKWRTRPSVVRYRQFCDAVRACWPEGVPYPEAGAHITFYLPMPKSWSKKRRDEMRGQPHRGKKDRARENDKDNLEKALQDALCIDDSHVWDSRTTKRWADAGYITITTAERRPNTQSTSTKHDEQ